MNIEIDMIVNDRAAEAVDEAAHLDDDVVSAPSRHRSEPYDREQDRESCVDHNDEKDGLHDGAGRELSDARGIALDLEAFVATDESYDEGEDGRLDHADEECIGRDCEVQLAHVRGE